MAASRTRRSMLAILLLLTTFIGAGGSVRAQDATFACSAPTEAAASPAAGGTDKATPMATGAAFPEGGGELTVFTAASLTDAFTQMGTELEAEYPGLSFTFNFAGSQALVTQLAEGAEADVFASANNAQMQVAIDNGNIAGDPVTFVRNRLAIVTPADNPAGIDSPDDLGNPDLLLVLAQAEVPVGRYSREAVCLMGADTATYGDDLVARVAGNVVSEEEDVRDVLAKVQLGEADAGIVYVSDAAFAGEEIHLIDIPDDVNIVATYPVAPVAGGDEALAAAFITYLLSDEGQAILAGNGFEPVA